MSPDLQSPSSKGNVAELPLCHSPWPGRCLWPQSGDGSPAAGLVLPAHRPPSWRPCAATLLSNCCWNPVPACGQLLTWRWTTCRALAPLHPRFLRGPPPPQHWLLHGHHLGASQNQPRTHVSLSGFGRIWVGCPFPRDSPLPSQAHLVCLQFPHGLELPVPLGSTDMSLIWRLPPWMPAPGSCIFRGESWWGLSSYLEVSRLCSPRTTSSGPVGPA